jgi:phage gpG-like protein
LTAHFDPDEIHLEKFDAFFKAVKASSKVVCRVGVLNKDERKGGGSNAEIAAAHEYGAPARGLPQRSFLRVPISSNLNKALETERAFSDKELKSVVKEKSVKPWLEKVGKVAEKVVMDAFDSGGDGKWPPVKHPERKHNAQILVETTQLRQSITSDVKDA